MNGQEWVEHSQESRIWWKCWNLNAKQVFQPLLAIVHRVNIAHAPSWSHAKGLAFSLDCTLGGAKGAGTSEGFVVSKLHCLCLRHSPALCFRSLQARRCYTGPSSCCGEPRWSKWQLLRWWLGWLWLYPHPTPCFLSLVLLFIVLLSQGCSESHQDEKLPALVGNIWDWPATKVGLKSSDKFLIIWWFWYVLVICAHIILIAFHIVY